MPEKITSFTIISSSKSNQQSFNKTDGTGGTFTGKILDGYKNGTNLKDTFKSFQGENLSPSKSYKQIPHMYGSEISSSVANPKAQNKGVVILTVGQAKSESDKKVFENDLNKLEKSYKDMGYTVLIAKTRDEYKLNLEKAKNLGKGVEDDQLLLHFIGHSGLLKKERTITVADIETGEKEELKSFSAPLLNHDPSSEGIFFFQNAKGEVVGLEKSDFAHEADVMKPIYIAAKNFDHAITMFDTCFAGAFDDAQFVNENESKQREIILNDIHTPDLR